MLLKSWEVGTGGWTSRPRSSQRSGGKIPRSEPTASPNLSFPSLLLPMRTVLPKIFYHCRCQEEREKLPMDQGHSK